MDRGTNRGTAARVDSKRLGASRNDLYRVLAVQCGEVPRSTERCRVRHAIIVRVSGVRIPPLALRQTARLALGPEWEDHGFVFTTHHGAPLHGANLHGSSFKSVMAAANLGTWGPEPEKRRSGPPKRRPFTPAFRTYDLRHSAATLLLLAGESVKVVSERLGHASDTLTLDTYSHAPPTMQEAAAEKLEQMFGPGA